MPPGKINFGKLRDKLLASKDGIETHRLISRVLRAMDDHVEDVQSILAEYSKDGPLDHCREYAMARLVKIVPRGGSGFRSLFESGLSDPYTAYWSIEGLIRLVGPASYEQLTAFVLDASQKTEHRAKAIREMALDSGQQFIRGLPSDPGYWKIDQMPLLEFQKWAAAGFPKGPGFQEPVRHPNLDAPRSTVDFAASRLESKLAKYRRECQDIAEPSNWLTPASESELASVQARWSLPSNFVEFLSKFSPLRVTIENRRYYQGLCLYGAADLISGQHGYSYNPTTESALPEWPAYYVVIADHAADPLVLDLSGNPTADAPILTAMHGTGTWEFSKEAPSFLALLERLAR
ncbi:MAG: SMI1/KNR4 family protein [Acidobacteria bacterium]|nr:SMI1/KNR4 family protein [Acidobacteriota bacterium]